MQHAKFLSTVMDFRLPDFGGTAHAYCGDNLTACIGDLMKWNLKGPSMEQALRAYIIKSRVRDASNLLLAQPYSPLMLRQGVQSGPHLLLQTLRMTITPKEAKTKWAEYEAAQKELAKKGSEWLDKVKLPCRRCSHNEKKEVMKPLRSFTNFDATKGSELTKDKLDEIWSTCIAKGQDLICFNCIRHLHPWRKKKEQDPGRGAEVI